MGVFEIIGMVIGAALGGGGIVTAVVVERMKRAEKDAAGDRAFRSKLRIAEREWISAVSRALFWMARCVTCGEKPNGNLDSALKAVADSEEQIKELERSKVANMLND